jgi:hypothetical protein
MITGDFELPDMSDFLKGVRGELLAKVGLVAEVAAAATVTFLRSYINEFAEPLKKGNPPRQRHPGNWADITHDLEQSYVWFVAPVTDGWEITIGNLSDHAALVEQMQGYYVIEGIFDDGGVFDQCLNAAIQKVAPDLEFDTVRSLLNFKTFVQEGITQELPDLEGLNAE